MARNKEERSEAAKKAWDTRRAKIGVVKEHQEIKVNGFEIKFPRSTANGLIAQNLVQSILNPIKA